MSHEFEAEEPERADWMGKTGLDQETEWELARYIRRELGQKIDDPDALKASDLEYLGAFPWKSFTAHYWRTRVAGEESDTYASVIVHEGSPNYDWGVPPPGAI